MAQGPSPAVPFRYGPSVFLAGAAVLSIELAGSKLLSPVYGSSLYVWSALIMVTLLAVAAGAWAGGWLADRKPEPVVLSLLWMGAALFLGAVLPFRGLLFSLADVLDLRVGVFLTALLFFFGPLAFLSAVSPLAVKLSRPGLENLGRTVGEVSAVGTAGGCFGALLTGFFLVPHFPLSRFYFALSLLLALGGVSAVWRKGPKAVLFLFFLFFGGALFFLSTPKTLRTLGNDSSRPVLGWESRQSLYGQVLAVEVSGGRFLFLDGGLQVGVCLPSGNSAADYVPAMETLGLSAVPAARTALVVGLGAGVLPSRLAQRGLQVDTAEINPQVVEVCRNWFALPPGFGGIHVEDGRRFLRHSHKTFDLVMIDAFQGDEVPAHLLTREAFQEARARLSQGGALVINYMGFAEPPSSRVLFTLAATLRTVFPSVDVFSLGGKSGFLSFILVARPQAGSWDPRPEAPWGQSNSMKVSEVLSNRFKLGEPYPFLITDDFCPLEWLDRDTRFQVRRENAKAIPLSSFGI